MIFLCTYRIFKTSLNINSLGKYEAFKWWDTRTFETLRIGSGERVEIVPEGLDCFGYIFINNQFVGKTDNMLIQLRFDITDFIKPGMPNIIFIPIVHAVAEAQKYLNGAWTLGQKLYM